MLPYARPLLLERKKERKKERKGPFVDNPVFDNCYC
jgi:hypothetical protein